LQAKHLQYTVSVESTLTDRTISQKTKLIPAIPKVNNHIIQDSDTEEVKIRMFYSWYF